MDELRTVQVGDIPMRWAERGTGPPVVLVHGLPTGPRLWRHVFPLVDGARLLAWEMVGYGASVADGRRRDISVGRQADYLVRWLDAMGLERVVLGGHDLGGGVAQIAAVRHPDRFSGLLLTNCISYDSWPIPSVRFLRALGGIVRRLPDWTIKIGVFRILMARGHDDAGVARESLAEHWPHYAAHGAGPALVMQMRALDVNDTLAIAAELPRLRGIPVRVVWGAADQFLKVKYGERLARDLGADLDRIEGARHFVPEDHPARIAAAVRDLVRHHVALRPGGEGPRV